MRKHRQDAVAGAVDPGPMTSIEKLPGAWTHAWNEEPQRARDVLTADARMWHGLSDMFDDAVGPDAFVAGITGYREGHGTRFTLRTLVVDGPDRLATTWDATMPDGTTLSGVDLSAVRDGRIAANWMVPSPALRHAPQPDVAGSGSASRDEIAGLCGGGSALSPGAPGRAGEVVVDDVAVWFGDAEQADGREAFTAFVDEVRASRPGLRYALVGEPVCDVERQTAAMLWTATDDGHEVGGVDVAALRDGRFAAVWSVTGKRALTLLP